MIENRIERFIIGGCSEEVKKYKESFRQTSILECDKNQWTYIVEIMIITIKSLVPDESNYGSIIDYERFNEELRLWYYYRHGENNSLLGSLYNINKAYWEYEDDSIFSRIVPIVFANEDWNVAKREILKTILYTTGNISSIFEGIALGKLLFIIIENINIDHAELVSLIKDEIVGFSQRDFIRSYIGYFRNSPMSYKGNYTIDFERKRIELLNILNGIDVGFKYNTLKSSFSILAGKEDCVSTSFFLGGLRSLKEDINYETIKDEEFIRNLASFLVKLRKGRISIESLRIDKYILPDVFKYKEGDIFFHTLLKKCQVIKRIDESDRIIIFLKTKSGIYRFMRNIKRE